MGCGSSAAAAPHSVYAVPITTVPAAAQRESVPAQDTLRREAVTPQEQPETAETDRHPCGLQTAVTPDSVLRHFNVFPPNVTLPEAALAVVLGPLFSVVDSDDSDADDDSKMLLSPELHECLQQLLADQKLEGQSIAQGVTLSSGTRSWLLSHQSAESLQDMQFGTVEALLQHNCRLNPGEQRDEFQTYIASWLHFHIRGSLRDGDMPHEAWVSHSDPIVRNQTAKAVGIGCSWQLKKDDDV